MSKISSWIKMWTLILLHLINQNQSYPFKLTMAENFRNYIMDIFFPKIYGIFFFANMFFYVMSYLTRYIWNQSKVFFLNFNQRKTNISCSLILTPTCAYQGVWKVSFSEKFAYVLGEWSLEKSRKFLNFFIMNHTDITSF